MPPWHQINELRWERLCGHWPSRWIRLILASGIHVLAPSSYALFQGWSGWQTETRGSYGLWLLLIDDERHFCFCFILWIMCREDTQAALWRGLCDMQLRSPASSPHQLASYIMSHLGKRSPRPHQALDDCSIGQHPATASWEIPSQKSPPKPLRISHGIQSEKQN